MIPAKFEETVILLAKLLKGKQYAFRGTTSVVLQGYDMNVDDIDILTDKETALAANDFLKKYRKTTLIYKPGEHFKSYFGTFLVNDIPVEVYGDWQIRKFKKQKGKVVEKTWSEVFDASEDEVTEINVGSVAVRVTTIETELAMYAAMGRWNVYHKLKKQVEV